VSFEEWEKIFVRLSGIMGKVTKDEIYKVPHKFLRWNLNEHDDMLKDQAKEYFVRFKKRHPEQLVLLHYNGDDRDTDDNIGKFFGGHWIYFNGCKITKDLLADESETEIHVEDPTLFHVNTGWGKDGWGDAKNIGLRNEDVGLCMLDEDGKPDWTRCEQVTLLAVDLKRKVIKVKRGCFETKPEHFVGNKAYAASHTFLEAPSTPNNFWRYNHSPMCPKDSQGRTATDILLNELVTRLSPGGDLECFDGLEFDVLYHYADIMPKLWNKGRGLDTTGDGKPDNGYVDGINHYGIGVYEFCKRLRRRLGEDKIIQADGQSSDMLGPFPPYEHQRAYGILNGIESEGWPHQYDSKIEDWSGAMNNHLFWEQNARKPVFNYINHKCWPSKKLGFAPWNFHRLIFAAAQFMDAALSFYMSPPPEPGERLAIWDELIKGIEHKTGWLGQPIASPVHLALKEKDLLEGKGKTMDKDFVQRFQGKDIKFSPENGVIKVSSEKKKKKLVFILKDIPSIGPELFITFNIKGDPMKHYPIDIARQVWIRLVYPDGSKSLERLITWCNPNWFESNFYFREAKAGKLDLEFSVENGEPLWISDLSVHAHSDAMYRVFENGLVLANPSIHDYTFIIEAIDPNRKYRRLIGSSKQDTKTNNGSPIGKTVTLKRLDGLFLATT
jgi:hypothetical protein